MKASNFFVMWIGLTIGNYFFAWFQSKDWKLAFDRSFFQGIAVFAVWLIFWMSKI